MFYSETILSRRGPLGKVWLAAHMERKLSKTQTLQTDIEQSVDAIMGQEIEVMALRLSGQLLLGVVRIYSRKAKYLLDDCNEALLKIKMAFRPGVVDMTEDQLVVNKTAITLQAGGLDLDLLLPDVNWDMDFEDRPVHPQTHHQAHIDDITLRTAEDLHQFDLNDPFDIGPSDGIGSQDFNDVDLGINWGDEPQNESGHETDYDQMSVDGSVGVGRDAPSRRASVDSHLLGRHAMNVDADFLSHHSQSREASMHPFAADVDMDFPGIGDVDLGDLGIGFDEPLPEEREKTPGQTRASSRASSPLTEPPATPPPDDNIQPPEVQQDQAKAKRRVKEKKQIIDSVTELQDGPGAQVGRGRSGGLGVTMTQDVSDIVTEQHFLPRSSVVMRLLEIRDDPLAHFLPIKVTPNGNLFCAAPPGLAPELAELFMRPDRHTLQKKRGSSQERGPNKRARLDENPPQPAEEVEQGRRAESVALGAAMGSDVLGRHSMGPDASFDFGEQSAVIDDYQLDIPPFEAGNVELEGSRAKSVALSELSRLSTPGPNDTAYDENDADAVCPIASFDSRSSAQSQTQTQGSEETEVSDNQGKGYSKNTIKALGLLRKELQPTPDTNDEKVVSFKRMSDKATRRAAASFFFELLVLGTRDCVQLQQPRAFENIEVRAKPKLWEQHRPHSVEPSERATLSRAGSVLSSMEV